MRASMVVRRKCAATLLALLVGHLCRDLGCQCRSVGNVPVFAQAAEHTKLKLGNACCPRCFVVGRDDRIS
jgi:hypothetical protein